MQIMQVLYLSYDGILDPLGQSQILPYIKCLAQKNIKFNLITLEKEEKLKLVEINKLKEELAKQNIFWNYCVFAQKKSLIKVIKNIANIFTKSYFAIKKNNIQIIHCRSVTGFIGFLLKLITNKKLIFDVRGFWIDERIDRGIWKTSIAYPLWKNIENALLKYSDYVVVLTNAMKQEILKITNTVQVIPTCVDTTTFNFSKKDSETINFVYSGSVADHYLLPEIVHFFSTILQQIPKAHLYFLVNNKIETVKQILNNFSIPENKYTITSVKHNKVPEFLGKVHFGITFLEKNYSSKGVAFTKVGEYLACGLQIIINKGIGDYDELLKENAIFIDDFNENGYDVAIRKIKQSIKDKNLAKNCRKLALEQLDLNKGVENYFKIYSKVMM